jgi:hypothetical protein
VKEQSHCHNQAQLLYYPARELSASAKVGQVDEKAGLTSFFQPSNTRFPEPGHVVEARPDVRPVIILILYQKGNASDTHYCCQRNYRPISSTKVGTCLFAI